MAVIPDPKTLLLPDPDFQPTFLSDKFFSIFAAVAGFGAVVGARYTVKKPLLSGIQHHILASSVGGGIGFFLQRNYDNYNARKDAMYRQYIDLHPEDFPMPERKKIGEVFSPWHPVR